MKRYVNEKARTPYTAVVSHGVQSLVTNLTQQHSRRRSASSHTANSSPHLPNSLNYSWYALPSSSPPHVQTNQTNKTGARLPHHCFPDQTRSLVLMFTSTTRAEPPSQNRVPPRVSPKHTPPAPSPFFVFSAFFFTCLRQTLFFLYVWGTHFHTTCFGNTTHPNTPTTQATKPARRQLGQACEIIFTFPPPPPSIPRTMQ